METSCGTVLFACFKVILRCLQLIQDALESQKKVMLLAENENQLKAQVTLQLLHYVIVTMLYSSVVTGTLLLLLLLLFLAVGYL